MARMLEFKWISSLQTLVHIDIDAVLFHDEALRLVSSPSWTRALMEMRADHLRYILELNDHIEQLGGDRVHIEISADLCEFHGFTRLHPGMSPRDFLAALVEGEQITRSHYAHALQEAWALELHALLARNFADERQHLFRMLSAALEWLEEGDARPRPDA